ncbi:MAG: hypothetical protein RIM23_19790 [Coleofasciculus sp. G3-WIS-01]|uniref:hypothetical protein n=1 Tax=Coleofasciculus sp. G3-WIS-01 TaxID=3069528 RepID=UPI0032FBA0E5
MPRSLHVHSHTCASLALATRTWFSAFCRDACNAIALIQNRHHLSPWTRSHGQWFNSVNSGWG